MCGIAGIIGNNASPHLLGRMMQKISHRGEAENFCEMSYGSGFAIATNRLAIVDSVHGRQPFESADGNILCVNNGEIYNFPDLRRRYAGAYDFKTECDTEVILAGYIDRGERVFEEVEGMYACFIYDRRLGTWLLARDHLGIKPLYYAWDLTGNFYFASELKAFEELEIKEIRAVVPGGVISTGVAKVSQKQYVFSTINDPGADAAKQRFRELMANAVKKMLPSSNEPVACLLSGGVDSSTVLYLAKQLHQGNVEAYTFYNQQSNSEDYESAKMLCATLSVRLITVSPSIEELCEFYLREGVRMTETFETPLVRNAVSYHYLCKAVRRDGYKFCLSGEGADEILGGYDYFRRLPKAETDRGIEKSLNQIHRTYLQMADRASMRSTLEVRVPYMDESLTSYLTSLPEQYRINEIDNKWILRHAYQDAIPDQIRFRPKTGMNQGAGYGSNDPGESIYYQAVSRYYADNQSAHHNDLRRAQYSAETFSLDLQDLEEVYNFCRFEELGFSRLDTAFIRPQLNTSGVRKEQLLEAQLKHIGAKSSR